MGALTDSTNAGPAVKTFARRGKQAAQKQAQSAPAKKAEEEPQGAFIPDIPNDPENEQDAAGEDEGTSLQDIQAAASWLANALGRRRRTSVLLPPTVSINLGQLGRELKRKERLDKQMQKLKAAMRELAGHFDEVDEFELAVEDGLPSPAPARAACEEHSSNDEHTAAHHALGAALQALRLAPAGATPSSTQSPEAAAASPERQVQSNLSVHLEADTPASCLKSLCVQPPSAADGDEELF